MSRVQANLVLLVAAAIWGSTFVVQQISMEALGPTTFTAARFLLGAFVVLPLALREYRAARGRGVTLTFMDFAGFALCGAALFTGALLQQIGIIHTTVTNAGFLTALYVPTVPLLALLAFRKFPHWSVWPSALGCLIGTYFLSGGGDIDIQAGDWWVIASALFWALHVLFVGIMVKRTGMPVTLACTQFFACAALGWGWAFGTEAVTLAALSDGFYGILYAGVLSVGIGFTLQVVGQGHTEPADAAIILSMETVFAAIGGAIFLQERLAPVELMGCALILACVLTVELMPLMRRRRVRAPAA